MERCKYYDECILETMGACCMSVMDCPDVDRLRNENVHLHSENSSMKQWAQETQETIKALTKDRDRLRAENGQLRENTPDDGDDTGDGVLLRKCPYDGSYACTSRFDSECSLTCRNQKSQGVSAECDRLRKENSQLRADLDRVTRERDAAIHDMTSKDNWYDKCRVCINGPEECKDTTCVFDWRGPCAENEKEGQGVNIIFAKHDGSNGEYCFEVPACLKELVKKGDCLMVETMRGKVFATATTNTISGPGAQEVALRHGAYLPIKPVLCAVPEMMVKEIENRLYRKIIGDLSRNVNEEQPDIPY